MSESPVNKNTELDEAAAQSTSNTFEVITSDVLVDPVNALLAEYANPDVSNIMAVTTSHSLLQASDFQAPEATAPEATAPEATAPEATAPEATAPEATAPEATAPEATAPEATAPEATAPEATAPEATAPEATAPEATAPEATAPEATAPEATAPEATAPEATAPEATAPEATAPEATAPEATAPEATAPEATAPEATAPEATAPEATAPEATAPEATAPEATAPEATAPEATAPEATAPEATAPEATAPEATAPEATAPEATAPEATAPEATAPEATAPEATAPEATAPEATAPEATAPEAALPPIAKPIARPKPDEIRFADLPLSREVQQAIQMSGYEKPTQVQAEIIPHMLEGRDVLAQSQTGTGKTAAFALPILSHIEVGNRKPHVLVLAPTRELAIQVAKSFSTYAACQPGFNCAAIYGGQDYEAQFRQLRRGVQVVVGTPGRVIDHINRGTLDLSEIQCLVLDEADEMLNMGFLEDVEFVLEKTPEKRQIALFSATLPAPIRTIAERYLNNPAKITIKKKTMTAESIRQRAVFVAPRDKIDALTRFLEVEETDGVIVFTKTKDATITVAEQLSREGLNAVALNGDMPQKVRERAIDQLKAGNLDILVATDVAARGLDVNRISHVFNYDLPHDSESYVHRVGRTGRAGRKGEAIIFLSNSQRNKLRLIERATKQSIEIVDLPTADDMNAMRIKRFKAKITEMSAEQDLTLFKDLISQYAEETGKPLEMIAAALAQLAQNGRPFFVKDRPKRKRDREDRGERTQGGRGSNRYEREWDGEQGERPSRGRGERRPVGRPRSGMRRYRLAVGRRDGVRPGNIVGAVANEAGIDGEYIGPIQIHDSYTTVDLPEGMPPEIYETLQTTRVAGKPMRLREYTDEPLHEDGGPRNKPFRKDKFQNGKGRGGKTFAKRTTHGSGPTTGVKRKKRKQQS